MPSVKVCVILPVYNGERGIGDHMLRQSIESILGQTMDDFRIIIVDDGSTDNTLNICESYMAGDNRVKVRSLKKNHGVAYALNEGLWYARAFEPEYICIQGSDDWSMAERLQAQVDWLDEHSEIAMAGCWYEARDHKGVLLQTVNDLPRRSDRLFFKLINKDCNIGYPMIRWEAGQSVGWYDPENFPTHASDYDFFLKIAENFKVGMVPQVLYAYRAHSDDYHRSLSHNKKLHIPAYYKALELSATRRQSR